MAKRRRAVGSGHPHPFQYATLSNSFLIAGLLGFLVSTIYLPKIDPSWAFALGTVFLMMVVASIISMIKGIPEPQLK